ncbi:hypothetical protein ACWF50_23715 [Brucella pseudogrignonensis]
MNLRNIFGTLIPDIAPFLIAQAAAGSVIVVLTIVSGPISFKISPYPLLQTLPNALTIFGTFISVWPTSYFIHKYGWRNTLIAGCCVGLIGALLGALANFFGLFSLYCLSCLLLGFLIATVQYYVYAATGISDNKKDIKRIVSLITACGFISAFIGSYSVKASYYFGDSKYSIVSFIILFAIILIAMISILRARYPNEVDLKNNGPKIGFSGWRLIPRGTLLGIVLAASSFGNMIFLMHATPIAMEICGASGRDVATVLQWHFVAMYTPAIVLALMSNRLATVTSATIGLVIGLLASASAIIALPDLVGFSITLVLCGIAWGLVYPSGISIMIELTENENRATMQGLTTFVVYGVNCATSLSTGVVINTIGWNSLLLIAIIPLLTSFAALMAVKTKFYKEIIK